MVRTSCKDCFYPLIILLFTRTPVDFSEMDLVNVVTFIILKILYNFFFMQK